MKKLLFFTLGLFLLGGEASAQKRNSALDFNVDVGYNINTKGGSGSVFTQIGLGKRFNTNFYWGLGTGIIMPVSSGSKPMIPLTSDFRLYFPLNASKLSLGGVMRLGYLFNTAGETTLEVEGVEELGDYEVTVEPSNFVMIQILPTLSIPISRRTDFNVGLGYTHFIATKGGSGFGAVTISSGFNFGKLLPLTSKPIINRGIQLSFDYGATGIGNYTMTGFGLAASYKFNPHLAVGLGFGYDSCTSDSDDDEYPNTIEIVDKEGNEIAVVALENAFRLFTRGVYRFNDKKLSPIAACDLGLRFFDCEVIDSADDPDYSYSTGPHFFVAPAVGGSLRMASNSYLDLKVGYHIEKDTSGLLLNLGFTHTFGWGAGKR